MPGWRRRVLWAAAAALIGGAPLPARAQAPASPPASGELRPPESFHGDWRGLRTLGEVELVNVIQTVAGKVVIGGEGFNISFETIADNLKAGLDWDDNTFSANNFRHPYQGSMYYNAARSNGYDFYQSSMFAFAGSWLWEYTGEAHNPSANDLLNTAVGGVALGETTYRLSSIILDNTATGSSRVWREIGGGLVSPMRALNRLLTGEAWHVHANPSIRIPSHWDARFQVGSRTLGDERLWNSTSAKAFVAVAGSYGTPFDKIQHPYDHFDFGLQVNFANKPHGIGRIEARGVLGAHELVSTESAHHVVAGYQHFDYIDNEAYTFGGQSIGGSYLSRFVTHSGLVTEAVLHVNGILLGATKSDHFNVSGRQYDYGPGLGFKFAASFGRGSRKYLTISHDSFWIHSVSGNDMDSYVTFTGVNVNAPLGRSIGAGLEYLIYNADRRYAIYPDVKTRNPELRVSLLWWL
jgi:uncharacterized protein DUF3943